MRVNFKKLVPLVLIKAFVIGNGIAMAMGAWPIDLPQWPYNDQEKESLSALIPLSVKTSDDVSPAVALGTLYFLHNELGRAENVVGGAFTSHPDDSQTCALYYAIQAKKAGAMWDFAFGQIKLHRLKAALAELKECALKSPNALDVQIFALATFAAVPQIGESAAKTSLELAQHVETCLRDKRWADAPPTLAASAWLAIARVYLYFAQHDSAQHVVWKAKAESAWNAYQALKIAPEWLTKDHEYVSATLAKI